MTVADDELLREFCAENFTDVPRAIRAGARRIELCDNLAVGGTSPSPGVVWKTVEYAHAHGARVMAMVRPRGGDFVYGEDELQMMEADISAFCGLDVDGVVFGCTRSVHASGEPAAFAVDRAATERLVSCVREAERERGRAVDITFHMAFDDVEPDRQLGEIRALAECGVSRILTHGGPAGTPIADNFGRLREFMSFAQGKGIVILPGAGITHENAHAVAEATGARELHGTKIVPLG